MTIRFRKHGRGKDNSPDYMKGYNAVLRFQFEGRRPVSKINEVLGRQNGISIDIFFH